MDKPSPLIEPTVVDGLPVAPVRRESPSARREPPPMRSSVPPADVSDAARPATRAATSDGLDRFLSGSGTPPPLSSHDQDSPQRPGEPEVFLQTREPKTEHEKLVTAAEPIFVLVAQLKTVRADADLRALRFRVAQELKRFEDSANRFGGRPEDVTAARYVLCALTDETVLTTPWGSRSSWSSNSLLSELHGETWGGEKVFQILDRVMANPGRYIALLCLIDLALMLGFEGRYRVIDNGRYQLEDRRAEIGRVLKTILPPVPEELSGAWRGIVATDRLRRYVPFWVVAVTAAAMLAILYSVLQFGLSQSLEPVARRLDAVAKISG